MIVKGVKVGWRRFLAWLDIPEGVTGRELVSGALGIAWMAATRGGKAAKKRAADLDAFYRKRLARLGPAPEPDHNKGIRVFVGELGNWPKVWRIGNGPPPSYRLKARYASPQGLQKSRFAAGGVGAVAAAMLLASFTGSRHRTGRIARFAARTGNVLKRRPRAAQGTVA